MNVLAIDTATDIASVALLVNGVFLCQEQNHHKTHAQHILDMIHTLLTQGDVSLNQLDHIVFGCGPGSFTGLRIACSVAQGLAYAHDLSLIAVSNLATIAWSARQQQKDAAVLALLDARMNEVYWSYIPPQYWAAPEYVTPCSQIEIASKQPILLAGLGSLYWDDIPQPIRALVCDKLTIYPHAKAMIQLALAAKLAPVTAHQAQPVYVRNQVVQRN